MGDWARHKKKKPNIVVYDNNYMEALYQTDYLAKKIMVTASLCAQEENWTENGCEIVLTSNELRDISGVKKSSLQHLKAAITKLIKTSVTVNDPNDPINKWKVFSFLPNGDYDNGILSLVINKEMKPLIQNLQKNFTQYHIENIKPLKSGYSIRIFELLKMNSYRGRYRISIEKLKEMFGIRERYKEYGHLKADVLERAKKELRKHCEIFFDYKEIRTGNKVTAIEFEIFKQEKGFSSKKPSIDGSVIQREEQKSELETEFLRSQTEQRLIEAKVALSYEKRVLENHYSELGKRLIRLGFVGDVEKYIEQEGREVVNEALNGIVGKTNIKNIGGLLREKVKALKEQKVLIYQEEIERKEKANKELQHRINKYISRERNFSEDYERFIDSHLSEEDRNILQKYKGKKLEELSRIILESFLQWIG